MVTKGNQLRNERFYQQREGIERAVYILSPGGRAPGVSARGKNQGNYIEVVDNDAHKTVAVLFPQKRGKGSGGANGIHFFHIKEVVRQIETLNIHTRRNLY